MKDLSKEEIKLIKALTKAILDNETQEFAVMIKTEKGKEVGIVSEGADPMIRRVRS